MAYLDRAECRIRESKLLDMDMDRVVRGPGNVSMGLFGELSLISSYIIKLEVIVTIRIIPSVHSSSL